MIERDILIVLVAIVVFSYFFLWIKKKSIDYFRTCDHCGYETYLGTFKEHPKKQHWRSFRCQKCGAELVHK